MAATLPEVPAEGLRRFDAKLQVDVNQVLGVKVTSSTHMEALGSGDNAEDAIRAALDNVIFDTDGLLIMRKRKDGK